MMLDDPTIPYCTQRDLMRFLWQIAVGQEGQRWHRCVVMYAKAEQLGLIRRDSNKYDLDAYAYATALWKDGTEKGWVDDRIDPAMAQAISAHLALVFLYDESLIP